MSRISTAVCGGTSSISVAAFPAFSLFPATVLLANRFSGLVLAFAVPAVMLAVSVPAGPA